MRMRTSPRNQVRVLIVAILKLSLDAASCGAIISVDACKHSHINQRVTQRRRHAHHRLHAMPWLAGWVLGAQWPATGSPCG